MTRKRTLRHFTWMVKESVVSQVYLVGTGPLWSDPNTHPRALAEWMRERYPHPVNIRVADLCYSQELGPQGKSVIAIRYVYSPKNEWVPVLPWYSLNRGNGRRTVTRIALTAADDMRALHLDIAGPFDTRKEAQQHEESRRIRSIVDCLHKYPADAKPFQAR